MDARTKIVCATSAMVGAASLYWLFRAETPEEAIERQRELNRAAFRAYLDSAAHLAPYIVETSPTVVANIQRALLDPSYQRHPRRGRPIAAGQDMTDMADPLWCLNKTGDCIPHR